MRAVRLGTILFLALLLGSCSWFPWFHRQDPTRAALAKLTTAFRNEVIANNRLDPIRGKVSLVDARETSPAMQSMTGFPTEAERRALEEWQGLSRYWQRRVNVQLPKTSAWMVPILEASRAASLTLLARLHAGSINYGQFNEQRLELTTRTDETIQTRAQELQEKKGGQSASATVSAFQNALLQQQLVDAQMQPARATLACTRFGNPADCY